MPLRGPGPPPSISIAPQITGRGKPASTRASWHLQASPWGRLPGQDSRAFPTLTPPAPGRELKGQRGRRGRLRAKLSRTLSEPGTLRPAPNTCRIDAPSASPLQLHQLITRGRSEGKFQAFGDSAVLSRAPLPRSSSIFPSPFSLLVFLLLGCRQPAPPDRCELPVHTECRLEGPSRDHGSEALSLGAKITARLSVSSRKRSANDLALSLRRQPLRLMFSSPCPSDAYSDPRYKEDT